MTLIELQAKMNQAIMERDYLIRQRDKMRRDLEELRQHHEDTQTAQAVIQQVVQSVQQVAHASIAGTVTRCLQTVFGDDFPHTFAIRFDQKRGRTEARLVLVGPDGEEVDPLDADAGGVVDVIAFALRLACLLLTRPARRRLLVADEPFKMLSREYRPAVRALLEAVSEEFGVQVVFVTHCPELVTGQVIEFS